MLTLEDPENLAEELIHPEILRSGSRSVNSSLK